MERSLTNGASSPLFVRSLSPARVRLTVLCFAALRKSECASWSPALLRCASAGVPRNIFLRYTQLSSIERHWASLRKICSVLWGLFLVRTVMHHALFLSQRSLYCVTVNCRSEAHEGSGRGVIVVSIVSLGGEVCIAYTLVFVNLWDPKHVLGYSHVYCSVD